MKKFLFLTFGLSLFAVSCGTKTAPVESEAELTTDTTMMAPAEDMMVDSAAAVADSATVVMDSAE